MVTASSRKAKNATAVVSKAAKTTRAATQRLANSQITLCVTHPTKTVAPDNASLRPLQRCVDPAPESATSRRLAPVTQPNAPTISTSQMANHAVAEMASRVPQGSVRLVIGNARSPLAPRPTTARQLHAPILRIAARFPALPESLPLDNVSASCTVRTLLTGLRAAPADTVPTEHAPAAPRQRRFSNGSLATRRLSFPLRL